MSVLIKSMEMPKNCEKCIYLSWSNFYQIYTCNAIRKEEPVIFNQKKTNSTAVVRSGRADNCPLQPLARCENCKYCRKEDEYEYWCYGFGSLARLVRKDDFCSYGCKEDGDK